MTARKLKVPPLFATLILILEHHEEVRMSHQYANEFLYFVIKPAISKDKGAFILCSGVNLTRFLPITRRRHGLASNPALRGLELVKIAVCDMALAKGALPKIIRGNYCAGLTTTDEGWFTDILLIENAPDSFPEEVIGYCAMALLKSIFKACRLEVALPDKLPEPEDLQSLIEGVCRTYGNY
jgi:hypothetical protein